MSTWKLRRRSYEFSAPDTDTLHVWIREGRVHRDDEALWTPTGEWVRAGSIPELAASFGAVPVAATAQPRQASRQSCGLAIALFLFTVAMGMLGIGQGFAVLVGAAAFVFAIVAGVLYAIGK